MLKGNIFVGVLLLCLAACGGGGGGGGGGGNGSSGKVEITCVDMRNEGGQDECTMLGARPIVVVSMVNENGEFIGPTVIQLGEISRDAQASISATFENTTPDAVNAFINVSLNNWCNGEPLFNVVNMSPINLQPDVPVTVDYAEQCSAASLGEHEITVTLYNDSQEIIDQTVGHFTLVEPAPAP